MQSCCLIKGDERKWWCDMCAGCPAIRRGRCCRRSPRVPEAEKRPALHFQHAAARHAALAAVQPTACCAPARLSGDRKSAWQGLFPCGPGARVPLALCEQQQQASFGFREVSRFVRVGRKCGKKSMRGCMVVGGQKKFVGLGHGVRTRRRRRACRPPVGLVGWEGDS